MNSLGLCEVPSRRTRSAAGGKASRSFCSRRRKRPQAPHVACALRGRNTAATAKSEAKRHKGPAARSSIPRLARHRGECAAKWSGLPTPTRSSCIVRGLRCSRPPEAAERARGPAGAEPGHGSRGFEVRDPDALRAGRARGRAPHAGSRPGVWHQFGAISKNVELTDAEVLTKWSRRRDLNPRPADYETRAGEVPALSLSA